MLDLSHGAAPEAVALATGGRLLVTGTKRIFGAAIDSRKITEGDLFVAVGGERTDGHNYLLSAAESGASAVLVEREMIPLDALRDADCSVILVENTVKALALLASAHKAELSALTVAVTGSVGKTTTRQYIYAVLSQKYRTHKTEGNYNNELGLPLTLLAQKESHEASVVELGMAKKGEISFLSRLVRPNIGVITTIGTSHIEHLGSREAIRDAKMEITEGMEPGGTLILNGDEPLLALGDGYVYVALNNHSADFYAEDVRYTPDGMRFTAVTPSGRIENCLIPTLGEHTVLDAMYAVAVGRYAGLSDDKIRVGLTRFEGVGMRQNIRSHNGCLYVLDYYNASAESMKASLAVTKRLASDCGGRCLAVLGNVLELGELSEELHRSIGAFVAEIGVDQLFTFGEDASLVAEEAMRRGLPSESIHVFTDIEAPEPITEAIASLLREKDCVLIKASNGVRMGRIADRLLND